MGDLTADVAIEIYEGIDKGQGPQIIRNEIDRLRAELASWRRTCETITDERDAARRQIDEARITLEGIAGATARAWDIPHHEFANEFLPWAQSRARHTVAMLSAAPVPPQPAAAPVGNSRCNYLCLPDRVCSKCGAMHGHPSAVPEAVAKDAARQSVWVLDICNAYESGVGHAGRPTAKVNPYRKGTYEHQAYALGANGVKGSFSNHALILELLPVLNEVMSGGVAEDLFNRLDSGQSTNTEEGKAWIKLRAIISAADDEVKK